jgi:hypothetical protein
MKWLWRDRRDWGLTLLGVWLVAVGLATLFKISVAYSGELLAILGVASGILILMRR